MTPTTLHVQPSTGRPMRSPGNQVVASIMEVFYFEFSFLALNYSLFLQYTPNY